MSLLRLRLLVDLGFLSRFLAAVAGASLGDDSASESGLAADSSAVVCCSAVALSPLLFISTVLFACGNETAAVAAVIVVVAGVDDVEDKEQF